MYSVGYTNIITVITIIMVFIDRVRMCARQVWILNIYIYISCMCGFKKRNNRNNLNYGFIYNML